MVHFHSSKAVKGNRQLHIELKAIARLRQCLESPIEKSFAGATRAMNSFGIRQSWAGGVNKQIRQRTIYAIENEPSNAGNVVFLPNRIDRQWYFDRPSRNGARWQQDGVAEGFVATASTIEHPREYRDVQVRVVVDSGFALSVVQTMQAANVLGNRSAPRNRHGKKQGIQLRVIEAFSDETGGRQDYARR